MEINDQVQARLAKLAEKQKVTDHASYLSDAINDLTFLTGIRQRIALMVVQAVAVSRHARHKDVALQVETDGSYGRFHLSCGGSTRPVIYVVEHHVESPPGDGFANRCGVVAVGLEVGHPFAEIMAWLAMQDRNFVARLQERGHQRTANEKRAADNKNFHVQYSGRKQAPPSPSIVVFEP